MGFFEIILIGISLSMDAFAVAICSGLKMTKIHYKKAALIALFFGGFQAIMPALGWLLGQLFASYVDKYDHYIAFALLAFLGAKMIFDVVKGGDDEDEGLGDKVDLKTLFIMAVATSIDALAVGVTFGMEPDVQIIPSALLIGATTFVISFSGVIIGNVFGARWKDKAQIVGGVMLILVGLKILLEGLGVFHLGF